MRPDEPRPVARSHRRVLRRLRGTLGSLLVVLLGLVLIALIVVEVAGRTQLDLPAILAAAAPKGYELEPERTGEVDRELVERVGGSSYPGLDGPYPTFVATWTHPDRAAQVTVLALDGRSSLGARDAARGAFAAAADTGAASFHTGLPGARGYLLAPQEVAGLRFSRTWIGFRQGNGVFGVVAWSGAGSAASRRDATTVAAALQDAAPAGPREAAGSVAEQVGYRATIVAFGVLFFVLALEGVALAGVWVGRRRRVRVEPRTSALPVPPGPTTAPRTATRALVRDVSPLVRRRKRIARAALAAKLAAAALVIVAIHPPAWPAAAIPLVLGLVVAGGAYYIERRALARTGIVTQRPPAPRRLWTRRRKLRVALLVLLCLVLAANGLFLLYAAPVAANPVACQLAAWCSLLLSVFVYRRARRHALLGAAELRRQDGRAAVLYLRSFGDDQLKVRARRSARQSWLERFGAPRRERFEEVVAWHLSRLGPVVAVSEPGEWFAPLGAAREELPDEAWQEEVEERMLQAERIAIVPGRTHGLAWEVATLTKLGLWPRAMIVFPPVTAAELRARWEAFRSTVEGAGGEPWDLPGGPERVLVVAGAASGPPIAFTGEKRDEWSYEAAFEAAAVQLDAESATPAVALASPA